MNFILNKKLRFVKFNVSRYNYKCFKESQYDENYYAVYNLG